MVISFSKYHAAGNDFIMIDNRNLSIHLSKNQINYLCHRHFGIGADGLILIQNHKEADFEMIYYNSDGKLGSFCGNGSRAAVLFAKDIGAIASSKVRFVAYDGLHHANLYAQKISILMSDYKNFKVLNSNEYFLDTGSPHHVIFVQDVISYPVYEKGKEIRNFEHYQPNGTNVNFVEELKEGIYVRTYERGVENETLSCGTGVTAAAICFLKKNHLQNGKVSVFTLGGELNVVVTDKNEIYLEGPAQPVFTGFIKL